MARPNRYTVALITGVVTGVAYIAMHLHAVGNPGPLEAIAGVAAGAFGFILNARLLWDILHYEEADLGRVGHAKNTIVLSLFLICLVVPYTIYTTFERIAAEK